MIARVPLVGHDACEIRVFKDLRNCPEKTSAFKLSGKALAGC